MMKGLYRVLLNNEILEFHDIEDIPENFDNLIEFNPEYPRGPHTDEEHEQMDRMTDVLSELLQREMGRD